MNQNDPEVRLSLQPPGTWVGNVFFSDKLAERFLDSITPAPKLALAAPLDLAGVLTGLLNGGLLPTSPAPAVATPVTQTRNNPTLTELMTGMGLVNYTVDDVLGPNLLGVSDPANDGAGPP